MKATVEEIQRLRAIVTHPDPCCLVCDNWRITWAEPERSQGKGICLAQPDPLRRGYAVTHSADMCRKFDRTTELTHNADPHVSDVSAANKG